MNVQNRLNINEIPVKTFKWLDVNNYTLDNFNIDYIPTYTKDFISHVPNGCDVYKTCENVSFINEYDYFKNQGVSSTFLNLAKEKCNSGATILINENETLEEPIILTFENDYYNPIINSVFTIFAKENSSSTIVFDYSDVDDGEYLQNVVLKVFGKSNSKTNIVVLQNKSKNSLNIDSNLVKCEDNANVDITFIELSGGNRITNLNVNLEGENSTSNIKTIYMVENNDELDINYIMTHRGRRSQGNMNIYGVLNDEAKKVFRGTLDFKKGSSKSKSSEIENTLLLSNKVVNKAVPLLLCSEDDVEGQHAATSGRIDDNKLFYLMSRGFSEQEAKKLIIESMFNPVIETIPVTYIREKIKLKLANGLSKA